MARSQIHILANWINLLIAILMWITLFLTIAKAQNKTYSYAFIIRWNPVQEIVTVGYEDKIFLYNAYFELLDQINLNNEPTNEIITVNSFEWSPNGNRIAVSSVVERILSTGATIREGFRHQVWNIQPLQLAVELPPDGNSTSVQAWDFAGDRFALTYRYSNLEQVVRIYDATNGNLLEEFSPVKPAQITQIAWHPQKNQIAVAVGNLMYFWDLQTEHVVGTIPNVAGDNGLVFSPTGDQIASIGIQDRRLSNDISIWDTNTFQLIRTLTGHTEHAHRLAWGLHGLASAAYDETIRIWDVATGETSRIINIELIFDISWDVEGNYLLINDRTLGIAIMDVSNGEIIAQLRDFD
ncbi:MAG TPA: hypothetical protein VHO69_13420 [Phototrophicaceae bacterium]|nr:hypothetical protein [Phototrophicaceae bacterium]